MLRLATTRVARERNQSDAELGIGGLLVKIGTYCSKFLRSNKQSRFAALRHATTVSLEVTSAIAKLSPKFRNEVEEIRAASPPVDTFSYTIVTR